jgi:hypothetical protein
MSEMRMPRPHRAGTRIAAAIIVAGVLAACNAAATPSPTPPPDPSALLTQGIAATSKLTGPLDITLSVDGKLAQSGAAAMDVSGSNLVATIDTAGNQGEVTVDLKGVQAATDIKADLRVVGGTAYVQASPLGATWYSLPLSAAKALLPSSAPVSVPSSVPSFDPSTMLAPFLKDPGVKITSGGVQQLDGRDQDVVTVTVAGSSVSAWLAQAESMTGTTAVPMPSLPPTLPDVPVSFWFDHASGQLSKVSTTIADASSTLTVALTIKAHSGTVSIQAPPADQTQDASQLLKMVMGAGGNPFASPAP